MSDLPAWAIAAARDAIARQDTHESLSQVVARALVAERAAERERCAKWLNSMPQNWELVCENEDKSDLSSDLLWVVYTVTGELNDRECNTLGTGDTPSNALSAAFLAAAIRNQEPER